MQEVSKGDIDDVAPWSKSSLSELAGEGKDVCCTGGNDGVMQTASK